jgi:ParB-like chromosome segregation protein Spo0J
VSENGHPDGVAQLSDDLIAKARAIASRSDELLEMLEDARQRLLQSDPERETTNGRRPGPTRKFKPTGEPTPKLAPEDMGRSESELSDGLRLLTSQMSADGADRQEIASRLREDFAIEDPEAILKSMGL